MNIVLCGMPMCGKSYCGKRIAQHLSAPFVDTDALIEQAYGATCREITLKYGEEHFRILEGEAVASLITHKSSVIATGGGTLIDPANVQVLKRIGTLVYLKTDVAVLWERLLNKPQLPSYIDPNRPRQSLEELANQRAKIYEQHCDVIIDTHAMNEQGVLWQVINSVKSLELALGENLTAKP